MSTGSGGVEEREVSDRLDRLRLPDPLPAGVSVMVVPQSGDEELYPGGTASLVKRLRREGLAIEYVRPPGAEEAVHNAADVFLPVLVFIGTQVAAAVIALVVKGVWDWLGEGAADETLHVRWYKADGDQVREFSGDGPAAEVMAAAERFLQE